jgi:hypothetical protein
MAQRRLDTEAVLEWLRLKVRSSNASTSDADYAHLFIKADGVYMVNSAGTVSGPFKFNEYYDPDVPPAVAGTYDDEFNDDAIAASWMVPASDEAFDLLDSSANLHISESVYHGHMLMQGKFTNDGAYTFYKTFDPNIAQAFTVVAKMPSAPNSVGSDYGYCALGIRGGADNQFYELRVGHNSSDQIIRTVYANGGAAAQGAVASSFGMGIQYLMLSHNGSKSISAFVSGSGREWMFIETRALSNLSSFTRLSIAPGGTAGQVHPITSCDFIRYFEVAKQYKIGRDV